MENPQWPPPMPPRDAQERLRKKICEGYGRWIIDVQGQSMATVRKNGEEARVFLQWLQESAGVASLRQVKVENIDAYIAWRFPHLRRATRHGVCTCLRSFFRFLRAAKLIDRDLAAAVSTPSLYQFEDIPRAFTQAQIDAMLAASRRDRSQTGLRDHAMLLMLATYGVRSGEVLPIDLEIERNRIRQCLQIDLNGNLTGVNFVAGLGGIALAAAEYVTIRGNWIEHNGTSFVTPVCGIFIALGAGVAIDANQIQDNGALRNSQTAAQPGPRAGIWIDRANTPVISLDFSLNSYRREPSSLPAVRITGNLVVSPMGPAVNVLARGAVIVEANQLTALSLDPQNSLASGGLPVGMAAYRPSGSSKSTTTRTSERTLFR